MPVAESNIKAWNLTRQRSLAIDCAMVGPTMTALDVVLLIVVGPIIVTTLDPWIGSQHITSFWISTAVTTLLCALIVPLLCLRGLYKLVELGKYLRQLGTIMAICALIFTCVLLSKNFLGVTADWTHFLSVNLLSVTILLLLHHLCWSLLLRGGLRSPGIRPREIALVTADGEASYELHQSLKDLGFRVSVSVSLATAPDGAATILQPTGVLRGAKIDEVVLAVPLRVINPSLVREVGGTPFPVHVLPDDVLHDGIRGPDVGHFAPVFFQLRTGALSEQGRRAKRVLDILVASIGLIFSAPILAVAAVAIVIESPGPILFRQTRLGFNGIPFKILKFRSMTVTEDGPVILSASKRDARVTRVGGILRRCSIDELPQLINVLRGEMSMVGPRPHALAHDEAFERTIAEYEKRWHVKPGLTGWAQVNGHRGEIKDTTEMVARLNHDLWYIRNLCLALDLKIIVLTFYALVFTDKAY